MTDAASRADAFEALFARHATETLIANLKTRVEVLDLCGLRLPMTINDGGEAGNCYICNPVTGYVDYAIEETRNFVNRPMLRKALIGLIRAVAPLVQATGLDRAVHVNNWLFSTNPAPPLDREALRALRDGLTARFPGHAIVLRSLNTYSDADALESLLAEGFALVPSRQVYLFDGRVPLRMGVDMKRDAQLLKKTSHQFAGNDDFKGGDYARCAALYGMLYLEKYTPLNPQYTGAYIAEMHQRGLIELEGFRDAFGQLVAFGGRFQYQKTLTQPLLGYDTGRAQKEGLYRLITAIAQTRAMEAGLLFNMSAGAAEFKRHRGAQAAIEYSAVYAQHLPLRQRLAISAMTRVLAGLGVPLLRRFEL